MRNKTMIVPTVLLLAALSFSASAKERCEHSEARNLKLDLSGVKTVVFDIGAQELVLNASKGAAVSVNAQACASDTALLPQLTLTQERVGEKLVVHAQREARIGWNSEKRYAHLQVRATLPDSIPVQIRLGSGDVVVSGVASLSLDVGSGDGRASHVRGMVHVDVGSGDIALDDIGGLNVISVGSGDLSVRGVRGSARIGSVNSGDLEIIGTEGAVQLGSVGSGDVNLTDIGGNVDVDKIGSGDLEVDRARGHLTVRDIGSGSVNHQAVTGGVKLPREH